MALATVIRDEYSAPFFEAAAEGRLLLRYSPSSDEWSDPDSRICSVSQADDLEWRESSRIGHLVSWTIKPGRTREEVTTPDVVLGIVEMSEGPWLSLWLPEVDQAQLAVGRAVHISFVHPAEGVEGESLPVAQLQ